MDRPTCPTCGKIGVQERRSNGTNRPHLANVESYDSGRSYFRGIHTAAECAEYLAAFEARVAETVAVAARYEAEQEQGRKAQVLIPRYKAIYGAENFNWERVASRWLSLTFGA